MPSLPRTNSFSDSGNDSDGTVTLSSCIGEPEFVYRPLQRQSWLKKLSMSSSGSPNIVRVHVVRPWKIPDVSFRIQQNFQEMFNLKNVRGQHQNQPLYTIMSLFYQTATTTANFPIMYLQVMGWAFGAYEWGEGVYRVLLGKPEGRRPLGRPRCRWVDDIKIDLQEVGCGYMDWIGLAQDRDRWWTLVSAVMNLRVPWNAGNFLTSCKPVRFSRRTLHHGVSK